MKKMTLAAAVSLGLALGASQVQADSLLFPYYQSGGGAYTFLSLNTIPGSDVHYIWNYDDLTTDPVECQHYDRRGTLTTFDLMQQTVGLPANTGVDLPALFGDASVPQYLPLPSSRGFMIVSNTVPGTVTPWPESTFFGQAIVADLVNGAVTGYKGLNNPMLADLNPANGIPDGLEPGNWNSIFTSKFLFNMTWYPTNVVTTSWWVLVTGIGMDNPANWTGEVTLTDLLGGVFDRDEQFLSGILPRRIVCEDNIYRKDFMTAPQILASDDGGIAWEFTSNRLNGATGALMVKLEQGVGLAAGVGLSITPLENSWPNLPY